MRRIVKVAAITYLVYLALALLVITPLLNYLPHRHLEQHYGRQLTTKWVLLNPFTLSLEAREATLLDPDAERFIHIGSASVNLSLESVWRPGWVLDAIAFTGLDVAVRRDAAGAFNFDDLLASSEPEPEPEPETDGELPAVTVHTIALQANTLAYTDNSRTRPLDSRWKQLDVQVHDLSTITEAGHPYELQIEGENGGHLHWQGTLSIPAARSEGHLRLTDLYIPKLWEIAEPWLGFVIADGRFDLEGDYNVGWGEGLDYRVSGGSTTVSGLAIDPRDPAQLPDTNLRLRRFDVDGIEVDGAATRVTVGNINVEGLGLSGWQEDGRISLAELFTPSTGGDSGEPEPDDGEASPWTAAVGSVRLADSTLNWRSPFTDPALLNIQPIEASVDNVRWPFEGDTAVSLSLTANEQASVGVDGSLALASGSGDLQFKLDGLPLTWFNPNLPEALKAHFTDGTFAVEGGTGLAEFAPTQIELDGVFSKVSVRRDGVETELTGLESLRLEAVKVDMVEHQLSLKRIALNNYRGRLHIAEDGSINAFNVWKEEVGEQAEEIAEELTQDKPWQFDLPLVLITDSQIDFMDQSLPIPFRTVIGELNGEIDNISSAGKSADVDLKGSVDGYAPVTLAGGFNAFSTPPALDLALDFNGVDMALLSPYSATYMGYVIEQGILNLNLKYGLKDNHLEGDNKVRMDQLKLGEKIDSDKAIDAPLKLALAVMTDANGVIDLEVPVSGDVNNPSFALGSVISKAFVNIITKAVTAPFKLLANLVGSEQDLQRLTFPSGSAEVGEKTAAKLDQLAAALQQRPGLTLSIAGRLNPTGDRERLQRKALQAELLEAGLPQEELDSKGPDWEDAIRERFDALPAQPTGEAEPTAMDRYRTVARSIPVSDQQLVELAMQRGVAVKTYLVNTAGLAADRAVVAQVKLQDKGHDFSGVMLSIDN